MLTPLIKAHLKKYLMILTVSFFLFSQTVQAEDRRTDKSVLVVMTFNAQFMWDGVAPEEGDVDFSWKHSKSKAEEHMRRIAQVIIAHDPDVVNMVEVENFNALKTLNNKFLAGRGYRPYLVNGKDNTTGQDVGMLTRIDPESFERDDRKGTSGNMTKGVSKNYIAKVRAGSTRIVFIGLHLIAFPKVADRVRQRQAQADAIRSIAIEKRAEGYLPIVLGDFNDYDGDPANRDHINSMPASNVLNTIRWMTQGNASDDLVNAASFADKANRYTAWYDANGNGKVNPPKEFTSIDHILLAPEFADKVQRVEYPHDYDPRLVTDHFPVVVRLKLTSP